MNHLQQAILKTICYADIFDFSLRQSEIHTYLIWGSKHAPPKRKQLIPELFDLAKSQSIAQTNGYFHFPGKHKLVDLRRTRRSISHKKIAYAQHVLDHLTLSPHIQGIFLTGALAMENSDSSDDIDIMVITGANKLWTARASLTLKLHFKGLRRTPSTSPGLVNDLLCPNMYLDETALTVPLGKQDLYTAHEVAQVKPLINKGHIYERFLAANNWINQYLPNINCHSRPDRESIRTKLDSRLRGNGNKANLIEHLAFKLQHTYMKPKITRETITPHMAYFHPRNTGNIILEQYEFRLSKFLDPSS